jgi:G3E family GTPase
VQKIVPIHILSGFLGSGKTTLLKKVLDYYKESGRKPAVIMNELGDVNLDGLMVDESIPMEEMLSGCICCTIRGDLGMAIYSLYLDHHPDVIIIESTGVANPMELIDGVTESSLLLEVSLRSIVTVVDAPQLLELNRSKQGKTFRLMQDQIRCANLLVLNKIDQVTAGELHGLKGMIRDWNAYAPIHGTVYSSIDIQLLDELGETKWQPTWSDSEHGHSHEEHSHNEKEHHHSHDHVMVYTHYLDKGINRVAFEELIRGLPKEVYRAKGILQFGDASNRFLFQFAYREPDFIEITPQAKVPNVIVFIGENFSQDSIKAELDKLRI